MCVSRIFHRARLACSWLPRFLILGTLFVAGGLSSSFADTHEDQDDANPLFDDEYADCVFKVAALTGHFFYAIFVCIDAQTGNLGPSVVSAAAAKPAIGIDGTFQMSNFAATVQPGEPLFSGLGKTIWSRLGLKQNARVVIHTFGTALDTGIGVYAGNTLRQFRPVVRNDNYVVPNVYIEPGFAEKQSLVQFDAKANVKYSIQIGSRNGKEGNIWANFFYLPPGGGLSASVVAVNHYPNRGKEYICGFRSSSLAPCTDVTLLVHNSTNRTLKVTPTNNFGAGVVSPPPFDLAAGKAKPVTFSFDASFNKTTPRTVSGNFTLTGRSGTTVVSIAGKRGLIVVKPQGEGPTVLKLALTSPQVRAGRVNEAIPFIVKLTNSGSFTAIGCHARGNNQLLTGWQKIDPAKGTVIGSPNVPITIAARTTVALRVWVLSQASRVADPEFGAQVTIDCANARLASKGLAERFDLSAVGYYAPVAVEVKKTGPSASVLAVPRTGNAVFRLSVLNKSATARLQAVPLYIAPFSDPVAKQFKVTMCQTATDNGACLRPPSNFSIQFDAPKNVRKFFKIFVKAPGSNPGFDPALRRVYLKLWQISHPEESVDAVVGAESIAVRRQ